MATFITSISPVPTWFQMPCIACQILGDNGEALALVSATSGLGLATCTPHLNATEQVLSTLTSYDYGLRAAFITAGLIDGQTT